MIKLAKYLKPFTLGLIVAIVLLFGQAMGDLYLPNFMSDIVNVGIQQNGIEHAAPDAITPEAIKMITSFMDDSEKSLVEENYTLLASSEKNTKDKVYKTIYPSAGEELYVKRELDERTSEQLDRAFGRATWTFIEIMKDMPPQFRDTGVNPEKTDVKTLELKEVYPMLPMLDNLPESAMKAARDKALANNETMLKQSGIVFAKAFYDELGANISSIQTAYILKIGLWMIIIAFLAGMATIMVSFLSSKIATGVARNLRKDVFNKIESFSNNEFDKFSTASLITRSTNDVSQIQQLLTIGIRMTFYAPFMGIGGVIMAVRKSASMSWILAISVIVTIGMLMVIMTIALPKFKAIQKLIDRINLISRENLSGLMVIRAFGTQKYEEERFVGTNSQLTKTNLFVNRVMTFIMPMMMIIMNGLTLLIIWVGAHQIAQSTMQVGDMMAFMQYAMQVLMAFMMISMMFIMVPRAAVSGERIAEVLATELTIIDPKDPKEFSASKKGLVEFKNVYFRYNNAEEYALCDISFVAKPGETTAIIGSTGSGKSTIANLALRFYDATKGQVMVEGVDVREVSQKVLRSKIGYVPQTAVLLSGTIDFNLKYGKQDITEKDVQSAVDISQSRDFVEERPEALDSYISQGATNVSGGQKQRLSIARALAKNPDILIFDDSFSALDFKTDAALRKSLKEKSSNLTIIVVAQRVGTIMDAEQIIVLDQGEIVGRGTHKELLGSCKTYYEIASSQLSKEELS
ncbi:MAG: ABC transporter ATP-binding protein [Tissierellia bacterium]|nr:ABC transporter ATP-binding protein [Tissierellia bacterium]